MLAHAPSSPSSPLQAVRQHRLLIITLLTLSALAYVVIGQATGLRQALPVLAAGHWWLLALAVSLLVISWLLAAGIYHLLTLRRLRFRQTFLVQVAGSFASRALPSGIGSLGVSYLYLRRQGCATAVAAAEVTLNNTLGLCGHLLILGALSLAVPSTWRFLHWRWSWWWLAFSGVIILVLIICLHWFGRWRRQIGRLLVQYRRHPGRLVSALLLSMLLTSCNILVLWLASRVVGYPVSLTVAAIALTVGVAAQTATPTPGGLGGVEAGIMAALLVWHVPSSDALASALVFRVVTFWLPLLAGGPVLVYVSRRRYL